MSPSLRFTWLLKPHRCRVLLGLALAGLACGLSLAVPLLVERVLIKATRLDNFWSLLMPALLLTMAVTVQAAAGSANAWLLGGLALDLVRSLRRTLYARLQQLPVAWYDRTPAGAIISRVMDDVAALQSLASGQTLVALFDILTALAAAGWLASRSWKLALVLAGIMPIYAIVFRFFGRRIRAGALDVRQQLDHVFGHLKQKIDGMQVVRLATAEAAEVARFTRQISALHDPRLELSRMGVGFSNLCLLVGGVGASLIFAVGALEVAAGRLTAGELIAATVLSGLIFAPITRLSELAATYQQAAASASRLGEILDHPVTVRKLVFERPPPHRNIQAAGDKIEFSNVSFGYAPDRPVLHLLSLAIQPGTKVAIVGPTGSGKTTLMNLLLRFYEPSSGEIRVGGKQLAEVESDELCRQIGVVPQEAVIFRGTLADNIRYGAPDADMGAVKAAARAALVDELAGKLPQGYETVVGEGGHPLSQGERQLIALARLFCKDPRIVVLDEATSALDRDSEAQIQTALSRLLAGRTTVIIAHRLATVLSADKIVVMDQGRVVQSGAHEQLWAQEEGLYRQLCDCQFGPPIRPAGRAAVGSGRGQTRSRRELISA